MATLIGRYAKRLSAVFSMEIPHCVKSKPNTFEYGDASLLYQAQRSCHARSSCFDVVRCITGATACGEGYDSRPGDAASARA